MTGGDESGEEGRAALREAFSRFGVGICPPDAPEGFRRFRRRLVFPVRTTGGQIAGFAGRYRGADGAGTAKYVNSDDSEAYHKGRILYGLYEAVKAVRAEGDVLLCEGYKDVIAFHAAGIRHAAGLCGTALTEDHVRMIRRLTGHVTLALDPDPAGQAATLRSARLLLARGCEVGVLPLPDGMDPDEVFRRQGAEALRRLARTEAVDYLSHRVREVAGRKGGPDAGAIREVLGEIRLVSSPLAMYRRVEELSRATGIPLDVLREELSASPGEPLRTGPAEGVTEGPAEAAAGLPPGMGRLRAVRRRDAPLGARPSRPAGSPLSGRPSGRDHGRASFRPHPLPPFLLPGGGNAGKTPRRAPARRGRTPALPLRRAFHTRPAETHGRTPPLRYLYRRAGHVPRGIEGLFRLERPDREGAGKPERTENRELRIKN